MGRKSMKRKKGRRAVAERSAGVVLFRADKDAPGGRVFLLLDYGRYWDYPKGHVEKGESDLQAAQRELEEETGIGSAEFLAGFRHEIVYFFRKPAKGLVRKTVVFFLASTATSEVRISDEHVGCAWVDADEAMRRLKFDTAREVFTATREFLLRQASNTDAAR